MDTDLRQHIATQCAPVLLGLKMSNILITHPDNDTLVEGTFRGTGLSLEPLARQGERSAFLVYRRQWLEEYVSSREIQEFLREYGYEQESLEQQIARMARVYAGYLQGQDRFPHEMGIFLGYPLEDVRGFVEHKGKNYLYAGYWKVYHNVEEAKATFQRYDQARHWLCRQMRNGVFQGNKEDLRWIRSM